MAISREFIRDRIERLKKQCERTPMDGSVSLAHFCSVFDVPMAHWSKLMKESGNFLLSAPYLAVLEQHPYNNMCFHYVVAYKDEEPVGLLYYQETDVHLANVDRNVDTQKLGDAGGIFAKAKGIVTSGLESIKLRLLINGNLLQSGPHGAYFSKTLSDEMKAQITDSAWRKIVDSNRTGKKIRGVLLKDLSSELADRVSGLDGDFTSFAVQPNMVSQVRPNWKNVDDVLTDFTSKYRVRARSAIKKSALLELRDLTELDIQAMNDRIMQLFKNVESKADFKMVSIHPRYFVDMKAGLADRFIMKGYFDNEKLVGFYSYIRGAEHNYASFVGIDYAFNKDCALYQNMLYNLLEEAILDGAQSVDLARTAMEIKSTMGAEPQNYRLLVKHLNAITNAIVRRMIQNIRPKEWFPRNPFRAVPIDK